MQNDTRRKFEKYVQQQAALSGVTPGAAVKQFVVAPSVQQKLEQKIQESSEFLGKINIHGVLEQEGEKIGMGVAAPIASTTDTDNQERQTKDPITLDNQKYRCEQTNSDTHIKYQRLDMWAKFADFQTRIRDTIVQRKALDRIMVGFNGISRAPTSNAALNPLLQDVNIGWLQHYRSDAPARVMSEVVGGSGKITIGGAGADYKNLDALVFDMVNELIDPWYAEDTKLVAICGRKLLADKYFPLVNSDLPPTEVLAADMIISQKRLGGLQAVRVPYFPANGLLITRLDNLSLYYQTGAQRRAIIDKPSRDRIENYDSDNLAYVVEDYGCGALAENIEMAA